MSMDSKQHLFSGFGAIAYAMALADGEQQMEEREKFKQMVEASVVKNGMDAEVAGIMFHFIGKGYSTVDDAYEIGMKQMKLGSNRLTNELKEQMSHVLYDVATAYTPITDDEVRIINRFNLDLESIQDDLTY